MQPHDARAEAEPQRELVVAARRRLARAALERVGVLARERRGRGARGRVRPAPADQPPRDEEGGDGGEQRQQQPDARPPAGQPEVVEQAEERVDPARHAVEHVAEGVGQPVLLEPPLGEDVPGLGAGGAGVAHGSGGPPGRGGSQLPGAGRLGRRRAHRGSGFQPGGGGQ